jgi:hypothetical protein
MGLSYPLGVHQPLVDLCLLSLRKKNSRSLRTLVESIFLLTSPPPFQGVEWFLLPPSLDKAH